MWKASIMDDGTIFIHRSVTGYGTIKEARRHIETRLCAERNDLLAALKGIMDIVDGDSDVQMRHTPEPCAWCAAQDVARAAIAKAERQGE